MLILLSCPRCHKTLLGENNSKVFFCLDCRLGFDVCERPPREFELFFADVRIQKEHPILYFSFWKIRSEYKIIFDGSSIPESRKRHFYVPSFFIKNVGYFGDIGYYLTINNIQLESGSRRDCPVFPADRGLKDSIGYPRIYLYKEESKKKKQIFDVNIDHEDISMVLIPFYKINSDYYDSIIFWKYPSGALV
jgi:hypothetical protein